MFTVTPRAEPASAVSEVLLARHAALRDGRWPLLLDDLDLLDPARAKRGEEV
jgi:hypothetical protein